MDSNVLGVIFGGVSAGCAIYNTILSVKNKKSKQEINNTEKRINDIKEQYKNKLKLLDDVVIFQQIIEQLENVQKKFCKATGNNGLLTHDNKKTPEEKKKQVKEQEVKNYQKIKSELIEIKNTIPEDYNNITEHINDILNALTYCIENEVLIKELSRDSMYSKIGIEDDFSDAIKDAGTVVRNMKYK